MRKGWEGSRVLTGERLFLGVPLHRSPVFCERPWARMPSTRQHPHARGMNGCTQGPNLWYAALSTRELGIAGACLSALVYAGSLPFGPLEGGAFAWQQALTVEFLYTFMLCLVVLSTACCKAQNQVRTRKRLLLGACRRFAIFGLVLRAARMRTPNPKPPYTVSWAMAGYRPGHQT